MTLEEMAAAWSQVPAGVMTARRRYVRRVAADPGPDRDSRTALSEPHRHTSASLCRRSDALRRTGTRRGGGLLMGRFPSGRRICRRSPPVIPTRRSTPSRSTSTRYSRPRIRTTRMRSPAPAAWSSNARAAVAVTPLRSTPTTTLMPAGEIGTDPELAMLSRRGTGYYKVPSLKGVWYRGPFGHGGTSPTLEDWLDATRLTGRGTRKPSPGHEYGLRLNPAEKSALVAFLRTL